MGAELRVALIGVIVASVGNQTTFARAQTIAPSAGPRWTEAVTHEQLRILSLLSAQFLRWKAVLCLL